MTTHTVVRALTLTSRLVSPVVTTAALIGLSIYAWRTWMRVRAEAQWEVDWAAFQQRHLADDE
ncbi:MAG: hypothetical protein HYR72_11610 [Deltaproteobacteria bacterium]|nr:hypothetical protein [Deltaproteobacteria bacterium]MBI3387610.1 hypothetical protein [Deltaproteobacteria bacterium]